MSGTLSYHAISVSQLMHADGGRTIERRSGTRAATTFRKLPSARPGARKTAANATSTQLLSAADASALTRIVAGRIGRGVRDDRPGHAERNRHEGPRARIDRVVHDDVRGEHRALGLRMRVEIGRA